MPKFRTMRVDTHVGPGEREGPVEFPYHLLDQSHRFRMSCVPIARKINVFCR